MGWLFKKKKVVVPVHNADELLRFPQRSPKEQEILSASIKQSVGLQEPSVLPKSAQSIEPELNIRAPTTQNLPLAVEKDYPFFLRVQTYQNLIKDSSDVKTHILELGLVTEKLENSEFNENKNYEKLKKELKKIHERLLFMDDLIFKK